MAELLRLGIRTAHVLAMAFLLGGGATAWLAARRGSPTALALAMHYEWVFWASLGILVLTGVGNLGALGPPGPDTAWGRTFGWKLGLVVALAVGSLVRTIAVVRARDHDRRRQADSGRSRATVPPESEHLGFLRRAYGLTTWTIVVIVVLAEVLAHG